MAREVTLARQLNHPHVCPVFDFERTDGHVFIVMRLAVESLRAELAREVAARSIHDRLEDAAAVAAGLAAIHEAGIVHRDLSTQNVLRMTTGHLAVSDFGLATDADQTAASVEGGTVAYMAPELTLGARASFASDVWAAGIIIHEIVFGHRPVWRDNVLRNRVGRPPGPLSSAEEALLDLCRACAAESPIARPTAQALVKGIEAIRRRPRPRLSVRGRRLFMAVALCAVAGAGGLLSSRYWQRGRSRAIAPKGDEPLRLEGRPADWTQTSRVLAEVPGRVQCMTLLPDGNTLRFVWGEHPRVAQDVDIHTGQMIPSPIDPRTYLYGCPSLSTDGRHLLFEDYDSHGRAAIFTSAHPDGSDPSIVAMADDMRPGSEVKWLGDGTAIVMDVDRRHTGIMDLASNHLTVIPREPYEQEKIVGWTSARDLAIAITIVDSDHTYLDGYDWPAMARRLHLAIALASADYQTYDGTIIYGNDDQRAVVAIRPSTRAMARIGEIPGQLIGYPAAGAKGVGFVSFALSSDLHVAREGGGFRPLTTDGRTWEAARCGSHGFILVRKTPDYQSMEVVRLQADGSATVLAKQGHYSAPFAIARARPGGT